MSENDMNKINGLPGDDPREPEADFSELDQLLQQLGVPSVDTPTEEAGPLSTAYAELEEAAAGDDTPEPAEVSESQPEEGRDNGPAADAEEFIFSPAPTQEASWLDNLLAFAESNSAAQPDEEETSAQPSAEDEEPEAIESAAPVGIIFPIQEPEIAPIIEETPIEDSPDADEPAHGTAESEGPEEVTGPDWRDAFGIDSTEPEEIPDDADSSSDEPVNEERADEEPAEADLESTNEYVPVSLEGSEAEAVIETQEYESPAPSEKGSRKEKEFRIETDYRHDFGEYDRVHPIKINRRHRTGCFGGIMYFLFILVTGALLGGVLWLAAADVLAINKPANDVEITIPDGYTIDQVTDILHDNGLINYKPLFKLFARFSSAEEKIEPGVYQLKTSYDYRALVSCMSTYSGYRVTTEVTIPEGYNLFQMFELLESKEVCTQEELWEAAANGEFDYDFLDGSTVGDRLRLEGYLFPDTYEFYINDDAERVLNKMLSNFDSKFTEEYRLRAEELGYSIHEIISIAAMVEKETGIDSERASIASVIYNRLNSEDFPYLQIDATIIYATYVTGDQFSTALDNPYNTYMYEGLPGPITNPGLASIRAALYPETTNYYYYAATVDFTTRFFSRYEDFVAFVESDEFQSSN